MYYILYSYNKVNGRKENVITEIALAGVAQLVGVLIL